MIKVIKSSSQGSITSWQELSGLWAEQELGVALLKGDWAAAPNFKPYSLLLTQELWLLLPFLFEIICYNCLRCFYIFLVDYQLHSAPALTQISLVSGFKHKSIPGKMASAIKRKKLAFPTAKLHIAQLTSWLQSIPTSWSIPGSAAGWLWGIWCNHFTFKWLFSYP